MFPIRDLNPPLGRPIITVLIIVAASYVWLFAQPKDPAADREFLYENAAIACELTTFETLTLEEIRTGRCIDDDRPGVFPDKPLALSVLVSMFLHGGLFHLFGNMWSLWIFGNNVEDAYGKLGYLGLYLISGLAATAGFVILNPTETVPLVGASGAIAGVMGAYLVLFPHAQVETVIPPFIFWSFVMPAGFFLVFWFVGQFGLAGSETGIAWEAHVVGFVAGLVITMAMRGRLVDRLGERRLALYR